MRLTTTDHPYSPHADTRVTMRNCLYAIIFAVSVHHPKYTNQVLPAVRAYGQNLLLAPVSTSRQRPQYCTLSYYRITKRSFGGCRTAIMTLLYNFLLSAMTWSDGRCEQVQHVVPGNLAEIVSICSKQCAVSANAPREHMRRGRSSR